MEDFKKIYDALSEDLKEKFSKIRFIGLDFDGVFTDNTVFQGEDGIETVKRSKADSLGIDILDESGLYSKENYLEESHGVDLLILSKESNLVISSVGKKINGEVFVEKLEDIKESIDIINVFRPSNESPQIAKDAIKTRAKVFWLQYGIQNEEAKNIVESQNMTYIANKCIKQEYQRLFLKINPVFPVLK